MDDKARGPTIWSLKGTIGKLKCSQLSGHVDVAHPDYGLHRAQLNDERLPFILLGVTRASEPPTASAASLASACYGWPLDLEDAYVRGSDLVASYRPANDWPYSPQLYWRANTLDSVDGVQASLSLLVSVQTHLLDTWPSISVASQASFGEAVRISISESGEANVAPVEREERMLPQGAMCCVIRRLAGEPLSYIEIMAATDFRELVFKPEARGKLRAAWQLFADFLEKGVIRRARVQAALLPRSNDVELALECCQAMEQHSLPLTT